MTIKITRLDLDYILQQIEMAEAGQPPVDPLLSFGLREVAGTNNNGVLGQSNFGASGQVFPTLTTPILQNAQSGTTYAQTSGLVIDAQPRTISLLIASENANDPLTMTAPQKVLAAGVDGILGTADDVFVNGNAAAFAAQQKALSFLGTGYQNLTLPGADGIYGTADDTGTTVTWLDGTVHVTQGNLAAPMKASASSQTGLGLPQSLFIPNITTDNGLSAPSNSFFTFFGQFFDHGLDKITTNSLGGSSFVFIPLQPDDPLFVPGAQTNFMILTRAQNQPGPDGILGTADDVHAFTNGDTPFVDQSQTYASDPSHQAFLRAYMIGADGRLHSTGALLGHIGIDGLDSMATWGELKANAAKFLGIKLTDGDVGNVPLLATDAYGNLILGAHGLAQMVEKSAAGVTSLREGNLLTPITTDINTVRTGNAFINDMAHAASPVDPFGRPLTANTTVAANSTAPLVAGTYNQALLDAHYIGGDGRVNENIGLTAIQNIFHSEHDRLLATIQKLVQDNLNGGDTGYAAKWVLPGVVLTGPVLDASGAVITPATQIQANQWNGERLFQAAKFATETQYQHIVFDEFARKVSPSIHVATGINVHLNPAITSEFANVVYRFGHSMLDENINLYVLGPDGRPVIDPATGQPQMTQEGLIQAFTNPVQFANLKNATANIVLGTVNQVGNEIDEFVTGTLQDNLLGLPLDLASLNIARGRDTGVAPLNEVRNQLFTQTSESQLKPYISWRDFGGQLKHPESLVNFVAAYGTHASLTVAGETIVQKRLAADALVTNGTLGSATFNIDAYNFMNSIGVSTATTIGYASNKLDPRALHDTNGVAAVWGTGSVTGVDNIDMWIGGLAERQTLFGGLLGTTFDYIFRTQMEALQDADRLYYLPRIEGMDYEESLADNSLAQLIRLNTNIKHLSGDVFQTPEYTVEASTYYVKDANGNVVLDANNNPTIKRNADGTPDTTNWLRNAVTGKLLVNVLADGTVQFIDDENFLGNTIVLGGTEGNDKLTAGAGGGNTIWGDGGNDILDGGLGNVPQFIFGGDGNDTIYGGSAADTLHGDAGDDTIFGGNGDDLIFGGDGNDWLVGGRSGALGDEVLGGLGNDVLIGNEGNPTLVGGAGDDWIDARGSNGAAMVGDSGAPTGRVPLYSGNDVMIGGAAGGDNMKGFSGDDIMLGNGSFTKFLGGLGFDWASFENATGGVDEDLNRKELIVPTGLAADSIRDIYTHTEGASGSQFGDLIIGTNDTKLLATFDELTNVNLITGLAGFFDQGVVSFGAGNILLGGGGNDAIQGNGGNDILDGDAWLHVSLSKQSAGAQIIREILFDANGNTWDPITQTGLVNAANVDTAIYRDVMANYDIALFGKDAEGFLTIAHARAAGVNDGTDRIRNIERLQFSDVTVAIDSNGNLLDPRVNDPNYDAVPIGKPILTESGGLDPATTVTVGQTLTANIASITDADGITTAMSYQWQIQNAARLVWVDIAGATGSTFTPTTFQEGTPLRVEASYTDAKGYKETVISAATAAVTLPGDVNTAPFVVSGLQFNGISDTTSLLGAPFDYFSPLSSIFADAQTASNALLYSATLVDGSSLASIGMSFAFNPVTGAGEFMAPLGFNSTGQQGVRVTATDTGTPGTGLNKLSVTNTFFINVVPLNSPPVAVNDVYTTVKNAALAVGPNGVMANDFDANGDTFTSQVVTGPAHGTVNLKPDGSFTYVPNNFFFGADSFTYHDTDIAFGVSNNATVSINVLNRNFPVTEHLVQDTGNSATDRITTNPAIAGDGNSAAAVFGSIDGAASVQIATSDAVGAWTFTPTLPDGTHTIVVSETNILSTTTPPANTTATLTFTLDTQAPVVTEALVSDTGISATDQITSNPALSGTGDPNAAVLVGIDGAASVSVPTDATGRWTLTPVLTDGVHTVVATETDTAGNIGTSTFTFTLDTQAPLVAVALVSDTGISATDQITSNPVLSGTGDPNAAVLVGIDGAASVSVPTDAAGGWTFTPAVANGLHTVLVTEIDAAGNIGSSTLAFTLDTIAPATPVLGSFTFVATATALTSYTLSGTAEAGSTVVLSNGTAAPLGTVTAAANGAWSFTLAPGTPTNIVSTITATATDLAGNVSAPVLAVGLIVGTAGNDTLTANGANATIPTLILGLNGDDVLTDGTGADTMAGGAGNDTYIVRNVGDVVIEAANEGTDTVQTTLGSYTLGANLENLTYTGTGNFTGTGNSLNNVITGGAGNDTFIATIGDGNDTYTGGAGIDTYDLSRTTADATVSLLKGTASSAQTGIDKLTTIENVTGGSGNDNITGDASNNILIGGAGNDTLDGRAGADTMAGGTGNDTYIVDNALDVVTENVGEGTADIVFASASFALAAGSEVEFLRVNTTNGITLTGNQYSHSIFGNTGNDTLIGGTGNDTLDGRAGADTMAGGAGNDTYIVDNALDVVTENVGEGTADIVFASVSYALSTTTEIEFLRSNTTNGVTLTGNQFSHSITGGVGNDTLNGGTGNDTLDGGAGADTMAGGAGNDIYIVDNALDKVIEATGGGSDTIFASVSYALSTGSEIEFLKANTVAGVTLTGNEFANTIVGGAGNDTLIGGAGDDTLMGGAGSNTFKYLTAGFGHDTITDWLAGANKIDLTALGINSVNWASHVTVVGASGGGSLLNVDGVADSITLAGIGTNKVNATFFS